MRHPVLIAVIAACTACQRYDFEPVEPVTIISGESVFELTPVLKPNVMLTVDRSGSMNATIDPRCQGPACATRMSELKQAVATFTALADDRVRLGLTTFPRNPTTEIGAAASCLPSNAVAVPLPAASRVDDAQASATNRSAAAQVNTAVQALVPAGGTPTGATLAFLGSRPELASADFRHDFVLLLTDGLPNCNANNPNDFLIDAPMCRCQTGGGDCSAPDVRRLGCLDADATVQQVAALATGGVKTIVVGFGADTSQGDARDVLERLARAGGVPRACQQSSECGAGDSCTNGQCGRWAFQASNRAELEQVLSTVLSGLTPAACVRDLPERPITPQAVSLIVDGQSVARGPATWRLISNDRQLELAPAFCEAHHGSTLQLRVAGSP
jgi:hypothetical protein